MFILSSKLLITPLQPLLVLYDIIKESLDLTSSHRKLWASKSLSQSKLEIKSILKSMQIKMAIGRNYMSTFSPLTDPISK